TPTAASGATHYGLLCLGRNLGHIGVSPCRAPLGVRGLATGHLEGTARVRGGRLGRVESTDGRSQRVSTQTALRRHLAIQCPDTGIDHRLTALAHLALLALA